MASTSRMLVRKLITQTFPLLAPFINPACPKSLPLSVELSEVGQYQKVGLTHIWHRNDP